MHWPSPAPIPSINSVSLDEQQRGIVAGVTAYLVWGALTLYWRHLEEFNAVELIGWRVICSAVGTSVW